IRRLMKSFASRAFRRPVSDAEIEPFVQLVLRQQVDPVVEMSGGIQDLTYRVYEGKWNNLPAFDTLEPIAQGKLPRGYLDIRAAKRDDYYGIVFEGKIEAPKAGEYTFEMASDDGARILIDGQKVVEHDGLHGQELRKGKVRLKEGPHTIRVEYLAYGAPNGFRAGDDGGCGQRR
ncbi:PA14 domain-containing protein, partial [Akkermansiaceae bacterium]|nr:PA14 domain-containing protein [Akkermansiaceae bacterium]